jgi:hypothetical protein
MHYWGRSDRRAASETIVTVGSTHAVPRCKEHMVTTVQIVVLWLCSMWSRAILWCDGMIVSGASSSLGSGGTFLIHPFRAHMIATAIMVGEYLYPEYLTCSLSLWSCKSLGLFGNTFFSVTYILCPLFTFSSHKLLPSAVVASCVPITDSCVCGLVQEGSGHFMLKTCRIISDCSK